MKLFDPRSAALATLVWLGLVWSAACLAQDAQRHERPTETLRIATYNIEHFNRMFDQLYLPERSRDRYEVWHDEEDRYEVAQVILEMDADIVGIQESCSIQMLDRFNQRELGGRYGFLRVFEGNTQGQWIGLMVKPGFEVLRIHDEAYRQQNPEGEGPLFGRGPVWALIRTPGGRMLWVGVTHIKSKYGNNEAVTMRRIRQIRRVRQIGGELMADSGVDRLIMLGDFNDDFGMDGVEQKLRLDAVTQMIAPLEGLPEMVSLTKRLAEADPALSTFHSVFKPKRFRSFIDHIFVSPALAEHATETRVIASPIAAVASDHYPVLLELELPLEAQAEE